MRVGVMGNGSKVREGKVVDRFIRFLQSEGYEAAFFEKPEEIGGVDALVVLGGDGAILHAAAQAAEKNIKIIGINYGTLGFLTEYEKEETEQVRSARGRTGGKMRGFKAQYVGAFLRRQRLLRS